MASRLEQKTRNALAAFVGWFAPVQKQAPEAVRQALNAGDIRQVLLIRPQQGIGDLLLLTPVLRAWHDRYPNVRIHVLASAENRKALLGNPCVHKIWVLKKEKLWNPFRFLSFVAALRREQFDLAVPVFSHTPSWTSFFLARYIGARRIWSFDSSSFYGGTNWSRHLADVELPPAGPALPEWQRYARLFEPLIGALRSPRTEFAIGPESSAWADATWSRLGLSGDKPVVGLFLGGNPAHPDRAIPMPVLLRLAHQMIDQNQAQLVLVYSPRESFLYKAFTAQFPTPLPAVDEYELGRLLAFLRKLTLFICPDGGTFHLAAAAGAETLGLFVSTDPVRWCPPGDHVRAIQVSEAAMNLLPFGKDLNSKLNKGAITYA